MESCKGCGSAKLAKNGKNKLGAFRGINKECDFLVIIAVAPGNMRKH